MRARASHGPVAATPGLVGQGAHHNAGAAGRHNGTSRCVSGILSEEEEAGAGPKRRGRRHSRRRCSRRRRSAGKLRFLERFSRTLGAEGQAPPRPRPEAPPTSPSHGFRAPPPASFQVKEATVRIFSRRKRRGLPDFSSVFHPYGSQIQFTTVARGRFGNFFLVAINWALALQGPVTTWFHSPCVPFPRPWTALRLPFS